MGVKLRGLRPRAQAEGAAAQGALAAGPRSSDGQGHCGGGAGEGARTAPAAPVLFPSSHDHAAPPTCIATRTIARGAADPVRREPGSARTVVRWLGPRPCATQVTGAGPAGLVASVLGAAKPGTTPAQQPQAAEQQPQAAAQYPQAAEQQPQAAEQQPQAAAQYPQAAGQAAAQEPARGGEEGGAEPQQTQGGSDGVGGRAGTTQAEEGHPSW